MSILDLRKKCSLFEVVCEVAIHHLRMTSSMAAINLQRGRWLDRPDNLLIILILDNRSNFRSRSRIEKLFKKKYRLNYFYNVTIEDNSGIPYL